MKRLFLNNHHKVRLVFFIFSIFVILFFIFTDKIFFFNHIKNAVIENAVNKVEEREKVLIQFINKSEDTLKAIRVSKVFNNYLNTQSKAQKEHLTELFKIISNSNKNFMQLRYIDKYGYEKIRIDRKKENDLAFDVKDKKLQDKSHRDYFIESQSKPLEEVWFSALDLNIENKKVEKPFKPTLRAILPIKHQEEFEGIIIINYFMKEFLEEFMNTPLYDMILVDQYGYTMKHYNKTKDWGFYKKEKYNITDQFEQYDSILNKKITKTENYLSKQLDLPILNHPILILLPKKEHIEAEVYKNNIQYISIALIVIILTFIASYFATKIVNVILDDLDKSEKLNKKLQELNSQLSTILNTTKDCISLVDMDLNIKFANNTCSAITKYPKKELLNMNFIDIVSNQNYLNRKMKILKTVGYINSFELESTTKTNENIILSNSFVIMPNQEEILIVSKDISELREKEKELLTKEQILVHQSKMAAMGEMLENIAHQWRQPLSYISTSVTGLQLQKEFNTLDLKSIDDVLDNVLSATKHLSSTIDDFRNFFSDDKDIETFKVIEIMDKTIFLLNSKFKNRGIEIEKNFIDVSITGLPNEFVQVLMNIFNNAKDELEKLSNNTIKVILIDIQKQDNKCIITITDNAGGIQEDMLSKIFEPYFTTKGDKGTGIGLYMSQEIIQKHFNGKLSVENIEFKYKNINYKGASFKIEVPI